MKPVCLFVMDRQFFPLLFGPVELERIRQVVEVLGRPCTADTLPHQPAGQLARVELIIGGWGMPRLDAELLLRLPRLEVLFYAAGTVKGIATEASWRRGVRITTAAVANALPTAEYAVSMIVLSLKRAWESMQSARNGGHFDRFDRSIPGCFGSTVGLLGLGKVGRLVAQRLRALEVRVLAHDPHCPAEDARALNVELATLETVFAAADVVSCHLPLTKETEQALGRDLFAAMRPRATFINTARGAVVREAELAEVFGRRADLYAVLDVTVQEPLPADHPLLRLPNILLTPHIAGSIGLECRRLGAMMVTELERYLAHAPLVGEVFETELPILA